MDIATIEISELLDGGSLESDSTGNAEGDPSVRIAYPNQENGYPDTYRCKHCNEEVTREFDDHPWTDSWDEPKCVDNIDDNGNELNHEVDTDERTHASHWLNSARVTVDGSQVSVSISVGDPRGAFVLTVEMNSDGELIMHVPYPGEAEPHCPLTEIHRGTYRIG